MARWVAYLEQMGASVNSSGPNGFLVDHGVGEPELVLVVPTVTAFFSACTGLDASAWNGPAVIVGPRPSVAIQRHFRSDGSWSWIACTYYFGPEEGWLEAWAKAGKTAPSPRLHYTGPMRNPYDHLGLRMDIEHLAATSRQCLVMAARSEEAGRAGMAEMFRRRAVEFLVDAADRHVELLAARARDAELARE